MEFKDYITLAFSLFAFIISVYNAFLGPRLQLSLHIMKLISERAKELNRIITLENIEDSKNIKESIAIFVRSIQLIEKFDEEYEIRLCDTKSFFLTSLYLEINDYIHNLFLNDQFDPMQIVDIYYKNESKKGKEIICDQINFLRKNLDHIHKKYTREVKK